MEGDASRHVQHHFSGVLSLAVSHCIRPGVQRAVRWLPLNSVRQNRPDGGEESVQPPGDPGGKRPCGELVGNEWH